MSAQTTSPRSGSPASGRPRPHPPPGLRLDIEGLRAIAVGIVVLYHLGVPGVSGGFAGVDVFFVISGYLITSLLVREVGREGRISLLRFYARRARRLLPAACLVLACTAIAGWILLPDSTHADLSTDVIAATLYVVNWVLALRSVDYLAEGAAVSPVQHYWSLSVEEQYYVVWPLLMMLGLWFAHRTGRSAMRVMGLLIAAVLVASFAWSVVHTATVPAASYFVTTTRVWELAIGSLLAFGTARLARLRQPAAGALAWIGVALLLVSTFVISRSTPWPGSAALLPTLGTAALIAAGCGTADSPPQRLLRTRPLVWVGGLSYALYLWHWPLIVIGEARWPDRGPVATVLLGAMVLLAAVGLAWLTKHLVEDPFRFRVRAVASTRGALVAGAVLMCLTIGIGVALGRSVAPLGVDRATAGATALVADPGSVPWTVLRDPTAAYDDSGAVVPAPAQAALDVPTYYDDGCQVAQGDPEPDPTCVYGSRSSDTTLALLGDSKMGQWFSAARAIAKRESWRLQLYLKSTCSFSLAGVDDDCAAHTRAVLDRMRRTGAPKYALVSQGSPPDAARTKGMEQALSELRSLGTRVVVLADNPTPSGAQVYQCADENPNELPGVRHAAGPSRRGSRYAGPAGRRPGPRPRRGRPRALGVPTRAGRLPRRDRSHAGLPSGQPPDRHLRADAHADARSGAAAPRGDERPGVADHDERDPEVAGRAVGQRRKTAAPRMSGRCVVGEALQHRLPAPRHRELVGAVRVVEDDRAARGELVAAAAGLRGTATRHRCWPEDRRRRAARCRAGRRGRPRRTTGRRGRRAWCGPGERCAPRRTARPRAVPAGHAWPRRTGARARAPRCAPGCRAGVR